MSHGLITEVLIRFAIPALRAFKKSRGTLSQARAMRGAMQPAGGHAQAQVPQKPNSSEAVSVPALIIGEKWPVVEAKHLDGEDDEHDPT